MEFTKSLFYVSAVHFLLAYSRLVVDLKRAVALSSLVVKSSETYYRKAFAFLSFSFYHFLSR